jgi:hypothetical protein
MALQHWLRRTNRRQTHGRPRTLAGFRPRLEALEDRCLLATYLVTSTADSGPGTLSDAISQCNAGLYNEIDFNIPGPSTPYIYLQNQLPFLLASGVFINGQSEGQNGNTTTYGASLQVILDGYSAGASCNGLTLYGSNCTVSGLYFTDFSANGIMVEGQDDVIGGATSAAGNYIRFNQGDGVLDLGSSNTIGGNLIGTNGGGGLGISTTGFSGYGALVQGNLIDYNGGDGIYVFANNVTIGGTTSGAGNVIYGNSKNGVYIEFGSSGMLLQGNSIGTDLLGDSGVGNSGNGVQVYGSSNNTIGGAAAGEGNLISGNGGGGVTFTSTNNGLYQYPSANNYLQGNTIGTNPAGTAALGNSIGVELAGSNNIIGGASNTARNLISGNKAYGVRIDSFLGNANLLEGNWIGTNAAGTSAVANAIGVDIEGPNNTLGGTIPGAGNLISGNSTDGVQIGSFSNGDLLENNLIGTGLTGNTALGNGGNGITISGNNATIGGTTLAAGNAISGNGANGVQIAAGAFRVQIEGDYIGINAAGTSALANGTNGVEVAGVNNTIGGTVAGAGNVISGNTSCGILIDGGASGVAVQGNRIGTNAAGTGAVGNASAGVEVVGSNNTIGGTVAGARNIISGNYFGVGASSGATGVVVQGNYIGTNAAGTAAVANTKYGVWSWGTNVTIGGTSAAARNVISGNSLAGILLNSVSAGNVIEGNFIGTNAAGSAALANNLGIEVDTSNNTIGGSVSGARNVISGNSGDGIFFNNTATNDLVQGNFIGLSAAGSSGLGNGGNGVEVQTTNNTLGGNNYYARNYITSNQGDGVFLGSAASGTLVLGNFVGLDYSGKVAMGNRNGVEIAGTNNTLGGTASGARNIFSSNSNDGVLLDSSASGNQVLGNFVGTDNSGAKALANHNGVEVLGANNTLGGTSSNARNFISGNSNDGVLLDSGASGNRVLGNFLGIDYTGKVALGNRNGVEIAGTSNTVGGTASGAFNVISANSNDGVLLDGAASGNPVQGNDIGTDNSGTKALGNKNGVAIQGNANTVGGTTTAARNIIAGNSTDGVLIGVSGATVQGNWIGLNVNGNGALANSVGVEIATSNAVLGGTTAAARNVISGNSKDGVFIDSGVTGATVLGNYIGTDSSGALAVANSIGIEAAGASNTLGGSVAGARNVLSGNSADGVLLDSTASRTTVQGDFLGLNAAGSAALANGASGVEVQSVGNTLGGTSYNPRNYIAGNKAAGVKLDSGASGNVVEGNFIGTDYTGKAALGNSVGVSIAGSNNTVGGVASGAGNKIADNTTSGILVSAGSGNSIRQNAVYANGASKTGPGITLSAGANNNLVAPSLSSAILNGSTLTVTGTFTAPTANVSYVLEFFANPSGDPEGAIYLGAKLVKPATTGTVSFTFTTSTTVTGTDPVITATLTDASGDTSAFSNGVVS